MWWKILLIVVIVVIGFILYISLTGKGRRDKIFKQIIAESFLLHYNKPMRFTGVFFEAVEEFGRENNGNLEENFVMVDTVINGEEIYSVFSYDPLFDSIDVTSMNKEDKMKEVEQFLDDLYGRR